MEIFTEPAAWVPTLGVVVFIWLLAASGLWFWLTLALVAAVLLVVGNS